MRIERHAFTLIEVLVSVVLIAIVILGILRIREQHLSAARYLGLRMQKELSNSLFLTDEILRDNGKEKSAYDLLRRMNIKKDATRRILREEKRSIHISAPEPIPGLPIPLQLRRIVLKGEFSSQYYRFDSQ
jgi:prepilin-type N-terminal cleavage/methylation domain-containing protein